MKQLVVLLFVVLVFLMWPETKVTGLPLQDLHTVVVVTTTAAPTKAAKVVPITTGAPPAVVGQGGEEEKEAEEEVTQIQEKLEAVALVKREMKSEWYLNNNQAQNVKNNQGANTQQRKWTPAPPVVPMDQLPAILLKPAAAASQDKEKKEEDRIINDAIAANEILRKKILHVEHDDDGTPLTKESSEPKPSSKVPACDPSDPTKGGAIRIRNFQSGDSVSLAVYQHKADLVSDFFYDHGEFEPVLTNVLRRAFEVLGRSPRYSANDLFFLDIGSNVGAMSATMWGAGIRTVAVDALTSNVAILKYSATCLNANVQKRNERIGREGEEGGGEKGDSVVHYGQGGSTISIYQSALGSPKQINAGGGNGKAKCAMVSETDNMGDAMMVCDTAKVEELTKAKYRVREVLPLQTLDFLLSQHVWGIQKVATEDGDPNLPNLHSTAMTKATIVKMDVEGQEWPVIQGGIESLLEAGATDVELRPKLIAAEIWKKFFTPLEAKRYATLMMANGYLCAVEDVDFTKLRKSAAAAFINRPVPVAPEIDEEGNPIHHAAPEVDVKKLSPLHWCSLDNIVVDGGEKEAEVEGHHDHPFSSPLLAKIGEVKPCVMSTVAEFTHWLPHMSGDMTNIYWVRREWRQSLTPWTQPPTEHETQEVK